MVVISLVFGVKGNRVSRVSLNGLMLSGVLDKRVVFKVNM